MGIVGGTYEDLDTASLVGFLGGFGAAIGAGIGALVGAVYVKRGASADLRSEVRPRPC